MKIIGIDPSINGTSLYYLDVLINFEIAYYDYLTFTKIKKFSNNKDDEKIIHLNNKFRHDLEKFDFIYGKIDDGLHYWGGYPEYVAIEDYSYSSTGLTFNIGEFVGGLKKLFYNHNVKIRLYEPTVVKMFGYGKGNAGKQEMIEAYEKDDSGFQCKVNHLPDFLEHKDTPRSNIVDSYFIAKLLLTELKLRAGYEELKNLSETGIKIFNRVTKNQKENLLVRDFICESDVNEL